MLYLMEKILEESWERIPSLDGLAERLAGSLESFNALYLGAGSDGVPIFALSRRGQSGRPALVISGGSGDGITSLPAAAALLEEDQPLEGFETWVICGLDAPRIRHNDAQLGALRPSLSDHALSRRMPWGPGEDPETGLPVDFAQLWQSDRAEVGVTCSPESLALARALAHIKPELVVSLRDMAAGGVLLASSQHLLEEDWESLSDDLGELDMQHGPRPLPGHNVAGKPGCLVLHSILEEARRYTGGQVVAVGPVGTWQFMQTQEGESIYLALYLPRFYSPSLSDSSPSEETRSVEVSHELRLIRGREQNTRVVKLVKPGHPADGFEVRVEKVSDPDEQVGLLADQPALSGYLAVEALLARRDVLRQALEAFQDTVEHLEGEEAERGMQVLMAAGDLDAQIKAIQTNKRYGSQASKADAAWWKEAYAYETVLLIQESLRCLRGENKADPKVNKLRDRLEELAALQMEAIVDLQPVDAQQLANMAFEWVPRAADMVAAGGPSLVRARQRVEHSQKALSESRRAARAARHLRLPPAERSQADRDLREAEENLKKAEHDLSIAEMRKGEVASDIDDIGERDGGSVAQENLPSDTQDSGIRQPQEQKDKAYVAQEVDRPAPGEKADSAELNSPEPVEGSGEDELAEDADTLPELPDPPEAEPKPAAKEDLPDPRETPPPRQDISAYDPSSWFIGPDRGRVELNPELDIEPMLPERLEIPPEWGRGPLRWKEQVPGRSQQPLLRRLARHLIGQDPVESGGVQVEVDTPGQDIRVSDQKSLAVKEAKATGWIKRRVEPPHRYKPAPPLLPEVPRGDGGRWYEVTRRPGA